MRPAAAYPAAQRPRGALALFAFLGAAALTLHFRGGPSEDAVGFVTGALRGPGRIEKADIIARRGTFRKSQWLWKIKNDPLNSEGYMAIEERDRRRRDRKVWAGLQKPEVLERLRHQKWAAASAFQRKFGYVEKWDDKKGEGIVASQDDHGEKYLVIRDEITRCAHNHRTLDILEFVEFFATDEMDDVAKLPLAKNVTGPFGQLTKSSQAYRDAMLKSGAFPKKWQDTPEEYAWMRKSTEWWMDNELWGNHFGTIKDNSERWKWVWRGDDDKGEDESGGDEEQSSD